ncbi:MAG: hypothetical protein ACW99U_21815 [Candidatus Thorarchaeota archaeon]|jgi:hypothetical protein
MPTLEWTERQFYPPVRLSALEIKEMLEDSLLDDKQVEFVIDLLCDMTRSQVERVASWIEESRN